MKKEKKNETFMEITFVDVKMDKLLSINAQDFLFASVKASV
jgi:hypothetical protein